MAVQHPPTGSTISVESNDEFTMYRWTPTTRHPIQWIPVFFGAFMLISAVISPFSGPDNVAHPGYLPMEIKLMVSAVFGPLGCLFLYAGLKHRRVESLTVKGDLIEFDTGPTALPLPLMLWFGPMFLYGPQLLGQKAPPPAPIVRKRYSLQAESIGAFTLEFIGDRQRLRVDHNADRIEIGGFLREPEREWLAQRLVEWQQSCKVGTSN